MRTTASGPTQERNPFGVAAFIAGALAVALSVCGQLLAARRLATDSNNGHPSADQSLVHLIVVAPSLVVAVLAVLLGMFSCHGSRKYRKFAACGIVLGVIAVGLTLTNIPGSAATDYWLEPFPGDG
ncbi:hypothetical protein [Brachybacterium hainanense]|uniref:Uncharacterized protein n=1 Tax=Brachybacterium hainanense TaxID=1541174 RepID=A0ABV6RA27_9MICO